MSERIELARTLFNETWDLIDKPEKTDADKILMLHKAHASCMLWREADSPVNNARGEWLVSHVYSLIGEGALALLHGAYSLSLCLENGIGDFDLAFGYEAVARAYHTLGDAENAQESKRLALLACEAVADQGDRDYALSCLADL